MERIDDEQVLCRFAEAVRDELIRAANEGFEVGALDGLCPAGTTEAAIAAMQRVDIPTLVKQLMNRPPRPS